MLNERQVKERINELKKEIGTLEFVLSGVSDGKTGRPRGSYEYTQEQINFLKECNKQEIPMKEIIKLFNTKFGTDYKIDTRAFYNFMDRCGIKTNIIRRS